MVLNNAKLIAYVAKKILDRLIKIARFGVGKLGRPD